MMQLAALLLAVTAALSVAACDQRTPTEASPTAKRSPTASSRTGALSTSATIEVRISGSAEIQHNFLNVPISVVNGVPGEACTGFGVAVNPERGQGGEAVPATWINQGNATHLVVSYHSGINWTDGLVYVTFTAQCPSGTSSAEKTVQAHR